MHLHILGICGTFMGGIAVLAKQKGFHVTGSDANVYPPMSTQLTAQGISLIEGYDAEQLQPRPDLLVVGNALTRGKPVIEAMLNEQLPYISGPQWLAENIFHERHVIAVAGTHGKTTTTSMIAWILHYANLQPGFLIGGVPENFGVSAQLGNSEFFVIEADEYDCAFFDKRSKFIHYHPRTLVLNNLEFDHADIFPDLAAIETQFHYLIRTIPGNGLIICNGADNNLANVLSCGCWTPIQTFAANNTDWQCTDCAPDGSEFTVIYRGKKQGKVQWSLLGMHNVYNALAALAAAQQTGIEIDIAIKALAEFKNVKRRLEICGEKNGVTVYDDFAHHPTAIATTLAGLRARVGKARIVAVVECGSNTMRLGGHREHLASALQAANQVIFLRPSPDWGIDAVVSALTIPAKVCATVDSIVTELAQECQPGDHVLTMSNRSFGQLPKKLLLAL